MEVNNLKFIRNILICIFAFCIVSFILNMAPGFKRDKFTDIPKLIIGDEDLTEELNNLILINKNDTVYLSMKDCKKFLCSNISYEEASKQITVRYNNKVAISKLGENILTINDLQQTILDGPQEKEGIIYLPVSEMAEVFNVEVQFIKEENNVIIDKLEKGIIKADVSKKAEIKFKPRALSKTVGEVNPGEKVSCYYTTSKGWRLIRTEKGLLRLC